jgi:large subunit ribosomal protein L21
VETLEGEVGAEVELGRVLAVMNDSNDFATGSAVSAAKVKGTIMSHGRGDKVLVFKFKRKKQYKKLQGHRQGFAEVRISQISFDGQNFDAPALPEKKVKAPKAEVTEETREAAPKKAAKKTAAKKAPAKKAAAKKSSSKKK